MENNSLQYSDNNDLQKEKNMQRAIVTFIVTIFVGYWGLWLGPEFGIIFSVATAGASIVYAIEKNTKNDSSAKT